MDLLLQVSEEELEEFPEPPVDHTDQDKPDRTSTGGTQSSNISHQLQTQTQTSTTLRASKVSTASVSQQPRYGRPATWPATQPVPNYWWPATQPGALHAFVCRKEQHDQMLAHIPSLLMLQVEPNLKTFSKTLSPEALRYLHLGIHIGKSHPYL